MRVGKDYQAKVPDCSPGNIQHSISLHGYIHTRITCDLCFILAATKPVPLDHL